MARPTKRPAAEPILLARLRAGDSRADAARAAGVSSSTLARWMANNLRFFHAVKRAEADAWEWLIAAFRPTEAELAAEQEELAKIEALLARLREEAAGGC